MPANFELFAYGFKHALFVIRLEGSSYWLCHERHSFYTLILILLTLMSHNVRLIAVLSSNDVRR
jgi:hypothetical protein